MGKPEIEGFLTHLAIDLKVSSSTQDQAFNALLFLYPHVQDYSREQVAEISWVPNLVFFTFQEVRKFFKDASKMAKPFLFHPIIPASDRETNFS